MEVGATRERFDAVVVGGGPAGLSAAIYLARACRTVAVVDCDRPGRSDYPQVNFNYLGFRDGVSARELKERGRAQAERFGARFFDAEVGRVLRDGDRFIVEAPGFSLRAQTIVLATGVRDRWARFPGFEGYVGRSMHWCILCDGYETRGGRVLVVGNDDEAAEMAEQLLVFTPHVTLLTNSGALGLTPASAEALTARGVRVVVGRLAGAIAKPDQPGMVERVRLEAGDEIEADHIFSVQGSDPNNELARSLCVEVTSDGYVKANEEGRTSVPGVYAAGDVTRLYSHQIATAVYEGATAASAVIYDLYLRDRDAARAARSVPPIP